MDYWHDPLSFVRLEKARQDIIKSFITLLETRIGVYGRGIYGATPSLHARLSGCWDEWYEAL